MVLPRRVDTDADDLGLRKRSDRITRRSIGSLVDSVLELADLGLVKIAAAEVRTHRVVPMFKVLILNGQELFYGFYDVVPHSVSVGGEQVPIFDLMGKDSTLSHFATTDDDATNGPRFVEAARSWFDSMWNTVAREYEA